MSLFLNYIKKLIIFFKILIKKSNNIKINKLNYKNLNISISGIENSVSILNETKKYPKINILINGKNNKIILNNLADDFKGNLFIIINGENNYIEIDNDLSVCGDFRLQIGTINDKVEYVKNVTCKIGSNVRIQSSSIYTINSNNMISIGNNCLFSSNVSLYNTDGHPMYDTESKEIINRVKNMVISDNCWLGYGVVILKNVILPKGTIVGWGSVVSKSFKEENTVIAGIPAKIIKKNVSWERFSDQNYVENEH